MKMPTQIEFASIAEAVAYLLKFGYLTTANEDGKRTMATDDRQRWAIIRQTGFLEVKIEYKNLIESAASTPEFVCGK